MMEGAFRSLFAMLNIDPEEVRTMVMNISDGVSSMEAKIADIQARVINMQARMEVMEEVLEITGDEIEREANGQDVHGKRVTDTN